MALIYCKGCGKEIPDSASFCPHCGKEVNKAAYCSKCGTMLSGNSEFCPNCGARTSTEAPGSATVQKKDKVTTALLAIFLGSIGVHYFYLGKTTAGILSIVISLCSCGIWSIIMFIQGIIILTMSDNEFENKFVNTDKSFPLF